MMTSTLNKTTLRNRTFGFLQALVVAMGLLSLSARANAIDASLINYSRWSGWHTRGATTLQTVTAVTSYGSDTAYLFAQGNDHGIYFADAYPGTEQVNWQRLTGTTFQPLAAVAASTYDLYAFARGDDTRVYVARRDASTHAWTAFIEVPGGMRSDSALAATEGQDGRLYLFARRQDQQIFYTSMDVNTRVWGTWQALGATTDVALGAASQGGTVYAFAKGIIDRRIYMNTLNVSGTKVWSGWRLVPGDLQTSKPLAATGWNGKLALVVLGDNQNLQVNILNGSAWDGWKYVPGGTVTQMAASVTSFRQNLIVTCRGNNSMISENILQPALDIEREVVVPASSNWVDTGFNVQVGANLAVTSIGLWSNAGTATLGGDGYVGTKYPNTIVPTANLAALVGRIGSGTPFQVGGKLTAPINASGRLYLRMNDVEGTYGDNQGSLTVTVAASGATVTARVNARDGWTKTGIMMKAGSNFYGEASGLWTTQCTAISSCLPTLSADGYVGVKKSTALLPSANFGSLIGWVNSGFAMGKFFDGSFAIQAPLQLSINDIISALSDNSGMVDVTIRPGSRPVIIN